MYTRKYSFVLNVLNNLTFEYKNKKLSETPARQRGLAALGNIVLQNVNGQDFMNIVWVNEMWVNANHSRNKGWIDKNSKRHNTPLLFKSRNKSAGSYKNGWGKIC